MYQPSAGEHPPRYIMGNLRARQWARAAVAATTYDTRIASPYALREMMRDTACPVVCNQGGQSDLLADVSAADLLTDSEAYCTLARSYGAGLYIESTVPHSTTYSAGQQTARLAYNDLLRADDYYDALVDLAAIPAMQDASDTTYWQGDGLHLNATGAAVMGDAFLTALNGLGIS